MSENVTNRTLNNLIEEFNSMCTSHRMIESFFYGDFNRIISLHKIKHTAILLNTADGAIDENFMNFRLEIACADKIFNDESNLNDVESETVQILQDIFGVMTYSTRWQSFCKITGSSPVRKFISKGEDVVTGWSMTMNIALKRTNGICNIPIEDYDYQGEYKAYCAGVRIYEDGILVEVVPSGDRYDYSSAGASIDVSVNGFLFYEGVSSNQNIPVVNSALDLIGSKVGLNWLISDSSVVIKNSTGGTLHTVSVEAEGSIDQTITDSTVVIKNSTGGTIETVNVPAEESTETTIPDGTVNANGEQVGTVQPDGVFGLDIFNSNDDAVGTNEGFGVWRIGNSTVNIKDSAGNTLHSLSVLPESSVEQEIDDVTVDLVDHEGTLIYTEDVLAEGVTEITMPIIYIRPANSGYGTTSYLTGDEGYNETNYPPPAQSSYGRPAILDPNNPKKLVYNNAFGHKHRFTGINGGYYDYATSQYKLADGTVSNQATVFGTTAGGTSYIIDNHTGIGAKWNGQGAAIFSSLVTTVLGLSHAGFSDYWIGSRKQHEAWIAGLNISLLFTAIVPFNMTQVKTSTPTFALETTNHHQLSNVTMNQTRADKSADSCYAFRWHF